MAQTMAEEISVGPRDALLVVDLQNDFCPWGALAVEGGDEVVPIANRLMRHFSLVVLTQDWHPPGHLSFASSHPGRQPFETITVDYGPQILWPDHCVQGTAGAAFHQDLDLDPAALVIRKGMHRAIDSYSTFKENDHRTPTGLHGFLRERGIDRVFLAGLALDFCVGWSAQDAREFGFDAVVIEDACRAIDTEGSLAATYERFRDLGVSVIREKDLD